MIFSIFTENLWNQIFYVNHLFHAYFLWIKWITLCISLFLAIFRYSQMWITSLSMLIGFDSFRQTLCNLPFFRFFSPPKASRELFRFATIPQEDFFRGEYPCIARIHCADMHSAVPYGQLLQEVLFQKLFYPPQSNR